MGTQCLMLLSGDNKSLENGVAVWGWQGTYSSHAGLSPKTRSHSAS